MASVFADVRRGKALAGAVGRAMITDASGNPLDIDELFGVEDVPEAYEDVDDTDDADQAPVDRTDGAESDARAGRARPSPTPRGSDRRAEPADDHVDGRRPGHADSEQSQHRASSVGADRYCRVDGSPGDRRPPSATMNGPR